MRQSAGRWEDSVLWSVYLSAVRAHRGVLKLHLGGVEGVKGRIAFLSCLNWQSDDEMSIRAFWIHHTDPLPLRMETGLRPQVVGLDSGEELRDEFCRVCRQSAVAGHVRRTTSLRLVDEIDVIALPPEP